MEILGEKIIIDDLVNEIIEGRIKYKKLLDYRDLLIDTRKKLSELFLDESEDEVLINLRTAFGEYNDSIKRSWEIHAKGSDLREDAFDFKRTLEKKNRLLRTKDKEIDDYYDRLRASYYKILDKLDSIDDEYEDSIYKQKPFRKRLLERLVLLNEKIKDIYPDYPKNEIFKINNTDFMSFERASKEQTNSKFALRGDEIISYFKNAAFGQIDESINKVNEEIVDTQSHLFGAIEAISTTSNNYQNASVIIEYISYNSPGDESKFKEKIKTLSVDNLK